MAKRKRLNTKKAEECSSKVQEVTLASNAITEDTKRARGTLQSVEQFVKDGVLKERQICSLERTAVHRISTSLQCVLMLDIDKKITFLPHSEIFEDKPCGRVLTRTFTEWLSQTELCKEESISSSNHFYELIRFHFALRAHPSCIAAVPIVDLPLIQKAAAEWEPVLFSWMKEKEKEEDSILPADAVGVRVAFYDAAKNKTMHSVVNGGSLSIKDGTLYGLELQNKMHHKHVAASVYIDGRHQGKFILRPQQTFILERPLNDARRFLFLLQGAQRAISDIYIRFTPEAQHSTSTSIQFLSRAVVGDAAPSPLSQSHTFLSEPSSQQFVPPQTPTFVQSAVVAIRFQLVCTVPLRDVVPISDSRTVIPKI